MRPLVLRTSLALLALLGACSGPAEEIAPTPGTTPPGSATPEPLRAPPPVVDLAPPPSRPPVRLTSPACGYGGSAPAVAIFIDVETDIALHGVSASLVVSDPASGASVGVSREPAMLRVAPLERSTLDFSTQGTTPFSGEIAAREPVRLQYFAGLGDDPGATGEAVRFGGSLRVTATLAAADGSRYVVVCETAEMWPSS